MDENRKELKRLYKNDDQFVKEFTVTDAMLSDLFEMARKEGVEPNPEEAQRSRPLFSMVIKGLIGRDIFDTATYFKVFNEYDPIFREAYRLIKSSEYDSLLSAPK